MPTHSRHYASTDWVQEIIESLMDAFTTLMSSPRSSDDKPTTPQLSFVKYTLPQSRDHVVTSESRGLLYGFGSTGFRTWEASLHLGTYLCCTEPGKSLVRGKRVIELGAGTGFVSLLCKKHLDAESMLMTDGNEKLVELFNNTVLKANNSLADSRISGRVWEWGAPLQDDEQFDVAIGADVVCLHITRQNKMLICRHTTPP